MPQTPVNAGSWAINNTRILSSSGSRCTNDMQGVFVINKPVSSTDEKDVCPFCQENLTAGQSIMVHTSHCKNSYHAKCMEEAITRGESKCPFCRIGICKSLTSERRGEDFRLFFYSRTAGLGPVGYAAALDNRPGYAAQDRFFMKVLELEKELQYELSCIRRHHDKVHRHIMQGKNLEIEKFLFEQERRRRSVHMQDIKREMQGQRVGPHLDRLKVKQKAEEAAFMVKLGRGKEQEELAWALSMHDWQEEVTEQHAGIVNYQWYKMEYAQEHDPRGSEWEEIPYPL
ncbi:hypothetical protein LTR05_004945 [Lithohypha guttulata]|uniref:RING-type domain-containing protein n=1 Tax=Lithohypha guttulata TaxID=1690604 RepID=A0AAN7SZ63_9EURO|nr:hypothetical protein LTR05_004945 [Lithohypha guttulata]